MELMIYFARIWDCIRPSVPLVYYSVAYINALCAVVYYKILWSKFGKMFSNGFRSNWTRKQLFSRISLSFAKFNWDNIWIYCCMQIMAHNLNHVRVYFRICLLQPIHIQVVYKCVWVSVCAVDIWPCWVHFKNQNQLDFIIVGYCYCCHYPLFWTRTHHGNETNRLQFDSRCKI